MIMLYYVTCTRVMAASRVRLRVNPAHCTTMTASSDDRRAAWIETTRRFMSSGKSIGKVHTLTKSAYGLPRACYVPLLEDPRRLREYTGQPSGS